MSGSEALLYAYLAGTALQVVGNEEQARTKRNILNNAASDTEDAQKKAIDTVTTEAEQLAPGQRQQAMAAAEQQAFDQSMKDIGAGGALVDTTQGAGNVSADFARGKAEKTATEGSRLSEVVRELSRTRAPGTVATEESLRRSAIAEQLGSLWQSQRGKSQAATLDADSTEAPGYGQLGGLVAMASGAALGAGAGSGAGAATGAEISGMDLAGDAAIGMGNNAYTAGSAPAAWYAQPRQQRVPQRNWWAGR